MNREKNNKKIKPFHLLTIFLIVIFLLSFLALLISNLIINSQDNVVLFSSSTDNNEPINSNLIVFVISIVFGSIVVITVLVLSISLILYYLKSKNKIKVKIPSTDENNSKEVVNV